MPKSHREQTRKLSTLAPGDRATVSKVTGRGAVRQRLLDMGLLPHCDVAVERVAPSGDPVWVRVRGTRLSLRREEARRLEVSVS